MGSASAPWEATHHRSTRDVKEVGIPKAEGIRSVALGQAEDAELPRSEKKNLPPANT